MVIQAWDFRPGSDFAVHMRIAAANAERTIAVLSPAYMASPFAMAEWGAAFAADPTGEEQKLLPVRVVEFTPKGFDRTRVFIDLVGLDEGGARKRLLAGVRRGRAKPDVAPRFPAAHAATVAPRFPAVMRAVRNVSHHRDLAMMEPAIPALREISLSIEPGQLIGIFGRTSATVLLESMAGRRLTDRGYFQLNDVDICEPHSDSRGEVAFVPGDGGLSGVRGSLKSALRTAVRRRGRHGLPDAEIGEVLAALRLSEAASTPVDTLSHGERQRAGIAVEVLRRPAVVFLVYPNARWAGQEVLSVLRRLADTGTAVIFTASRREELSICDRVILLAQDDLAFDGPAAEMPEDKEDVL